VDGILLFDKPILWTSHDAVDFVRRLAGQRAVGHAGTLDPLATGLLVLLIGKATKLSGTLVGMDKDYEGTLTLGFSTDTQDLEGRILAQADPGMVTAGDLRRELAGMTGERDQETPFYSAAKRGGRKLYDLARRGGVAEAPLPLRRVRIDAFDLRFFEPPDAAFALTCSKGTYVRALTEELGRRLGCGAVLSSLVRTRIGPYRLSDALTEPALRSPEGRQALVRALRPVA